VVLSLFRLIFVSNSYVDFQMHCNIPLNSFSRFFFYPLQYLTAIAVHLCLPLYVRKSKVNMRIWEKKGTLSDSCRNFGCSNCFVGNLCPCGPSPDGPARSGYTAFSRPPPLYRLLLSFSE